MRLARAERLLIGAALAVLVVVQVGALALQFKRGFVPFRSPPTQRVPYSWDMFATAIDRCDLRWSPPIPLAGGLGGLGAAGRALEWWPVFDHVADYELAGRDGCEAAVDPTQVQLRCLLADGGSLERDFDCR